jgi:hypothetical protein
MQSNGNINYSLNKNDFYKVIVGGVTSFIPFYYIVTVISLIYLYTIRFQQYIFPDRDKKYRKDEDLPHYLKSITFNSPFNILAISYFPSENNENNSIPHYIGLQKSSYIILVVTYLVTYLVILEGLLRNFIYTIMINIIQVNPINNPYKNMNCVTKLTTNANTLTSANYSGITSLALVFLVPFAIPYLIKILKFDNFDIKKNKWFSYVILFFVLFPFIIILISRASFDSKLEIFSNLNNYVETKDTSFITYISNLFNFKLYQIIVFIFILIATAYYLLLNIEIKFTEKKYKILGYLLIIFILFILIPVILVFTGLSIVYSNNYSEPVDNILSNIQKNPVGSLYELLVKYNYPCIKK